MDTQDKNQINTKHYKKRVNSSVYRKITIYKSALLTNRMHNKVSEKSSEAMISKVVNVLTKLVNVQKRI